jgi:hypothetical protein
MESFYSAVESPSAGKMNTNATTSTTKKRARSEEASGSVPPPALSKVETEDAIFFYGLKDRFGFLSNFFPAHFADAEGRKFNCSEQYFMFRKWQQFDAANADLGKRIMAEKSPTAIKKYGRQVQNFDQGVWSSASTDAMVDGLRLKFSGRPPRQTARYGIQADVRGGAPRPYLGHWVCGGEGDCDDGRAAWAENWEQ